MEYNFKINRRVARKLSEEFKMSYADIGEIYNSSREGISRLFRDNYNNKEANSIVDIASIEEIDLISKMVDKRLYNYFDEEYNIKLINNLSGKYAFIVKRYNITKVFFDDDIKDVKEWEKIVKVVQEKRLDELNEEEIELIEKSKEIIVLKQKYFRPNDYKKFHRLKKLRNMNEEDYVKFLGFEQYASKKIENTDDKIIEFFENNLIDGKVNIVYNSWIRNYITRQNMSVEEFVKFFGYEQYNTKGKHIRKEEKVEKDTNFIKVILDKLELEQKNKDKIRQIQSNEKLIVERSKDIIQDLKKLYKGRCQICHNKLDNIIIQKDNSIYCEAHHIKQLSYAKLNIEEENEILDNYKNIIILCPHHHRYLHYNKGGNYKLKKDNGQFYFENDYDRINVEINYHL